ncbi:MAG: tripartite tricarboxylate transporter substrate binding protein [Pseudomonadota bacterium]
MSTSGGPERAAGSPGGAAAPAVAWASGAALCLLASLALAQGAPDYPRKPIRLMVPFSAGGPVDIFARSLTPRMGEALGQPVVVDNRGGAGSVLGTEAVARAAPDGYSLLMVSASFVMNPALVRKLPYDSVRDFAFITVLAEVPSAIVVHPSLPARNVKDLIALARKRPGELAYSSPGYAALGHMAAEYLNAISGTRMLHVPYKGAGPAAVDLMAGHVQMLITALPGVVGPVREGRLRMLAQTGSRRSPAMPDVPTALEAGLADFVVTSPFGLLAPAGTARPIVDRVRSAALAAMDDPTVARRIADLGAERVGNTPEEHEALTRAEIARWTRVAKTARIEGP